MRILVTGALGTLGSPLGVELTARGHEVVGLRPAARAGLALRPRRRRRVPRAGARLQARPAGARLPPRRRVRAPQRRELLRAAVAHGDGRDAQRARAVRRARGQARVRVLLGGLRRGRRRLARRGPDRAPGDPAPERLRALEVGERAPDPRASPSATPTSRRCGCGSSTPTGPARSPTPTAPSSRCSAARRCAARRCRCSRATTARSCTSTTSRRRWPTSRTRFKPGMVVNIGGRDYRSVEELAEIVIAEAGGGAIEDGRRGPPQHALEAPRHLRRRGRARPRPPDNARIRNPQHDRVDEGETACRTDALR